MQSCFVLNSLESLSQNPASCEFCLCYGCTLKLRYQLLHSLRQHVILRNFSRAVAVAASTFSSDVTCEVLQKAIKGL